jgi:AcrR family transcriptional regulator
MTPRPRKASDEDIFAATYRAMGRLGPGELTLADIADEAGVTAGALVQRFGSKRQLQLAFAKSATAFAGAFIRQLRDKHDSPIAALRDYAACMAQMAETPAALARSLAYLQIDISDADFRKHLLVQSKATRAGMVALLDEAVARRELVKGTDTARLARVIESALGGALITWAVYREGTADAWLRDHVEAILGPHLMPRLARSRRSRKR